MAARHGWLLLLQVLLACQAVDVIRGDALFIFDVDVQANIYATTSGFLMYPRPHNGCTPFIDRPPTKSNWFALLDDYNTCTLEKINNTRNAGFQMLFTASENDTDRKLADKVKNSEFPIAVPRINQAEYLKDNASTDVEGPIYVTVQLLIDNGKLEIQVLVIDNSSYPITPAPPDSSTVPLIVIVCLVSVFIIVTITMIGIKCAQSLSQNDSDSMDVTSVYGAIEKQKATTTNTNTHTSIQSDMTKQKASVQLVNMKDSFRTHTSTSRQHSNRGGGGVTTTTTTEKTHLKSHHHHHTNRGILRQLSLPANPQAYSQLRAEPPSEHSPSDTRTASWVNSHFGSSCSESVLVRAYDPQTDSCTPACVVCVEKFKEGESVVALPCDDHHIFHWKCITERLARSGMKCPLCTAQI